MIKEANNIGLGKGWLSKLWTTVILPNLPTIIGLMIGGPVGGAIGAIVGRIIAGNTENIENNRISSEVPDEFPLTSTEASVLTRFIDVQLKPTIANLANKVDAIIGTSVSSRLTETSGNEVIDAANSVLKDVAIIRANTKVLLEFGEQVITRTVGLRSSNYVANKVEAIEVLLSALEKAVLQYIEDNNYAYQMVLEPFTASDTTTIETMQLDWQGKSATANKAVYVPASQPLSSNQTTTTVVNTNPNGDAEGIIIVDATNEDVEIKNKSNTLIKLVLGLSVVVLVYKAINKSNKDEE